MFCNLWIQKIHYILNSCGHNKEKEKTMSQKNKISWNWNSNAGKVLQKCGIALFFVLPNTDLWYSKSQAVVTKTSSSQTKNI